MDNTFLLEPVNISRRRKLLSWLITFHDRRTLFTQFRNDLHIEKLESENIGYILPDSYLVSANEITRFYHDRDKKINAHHNRYVEAQRTLATQIHEAEKEHEILKEKRLVERKNLDSLRRKLKSKMPSDDYIAMEARTSKADAKLNNTDAAIKNCENHISELVNIRKQNLITWKKQVKDIEKTIEMYINDYVKRATSKIEIKYGFTEFRHAIAKYDDEVNKMINGE